MAQGSKIEWLAGDDGSKGSTWNPIRARLKEPIAKIINGELVSVDQRWGYHCERVSPGCKNCYASTMNGRMLPAWGTGLDYTVPNREKVEIFLDEAELLKPLKWKKPRRIFVESMSDWCATFVSDEMRDRIMAIAALCPQHTFLFLTKRADECAEYFLNVERPRLDFADSRAESIMDEMRSLGIDVAALRWPLPNVHLGFSAENQTCFDERWWHMYKLAAAGWRVWCSAEPLLSGVNIRAASALSWVVVGGESGHGARPCNVDWIRSIVRQCSDAGVACFVKQLGAEPGQGDWHPWKLADRKGGDMDEWPEDLRVRQFPIAGGER